MIRSKTFLKGRADLASAVAKRWHDLGLKPRMYRNATGCDIYGSDLSALRLGDPDHRVGIDRLAALAEWLGIEVHCVAVPRDVPEHVRRAIDRSKRNDRHLHPGQVALAKGSRTARIMSAR